VVPFRPGTTWSTQSLAHDDAEDEHTTLPMSARTHL